MSCNQSLVEGVGDRLVAAASTPVELVPAGTVASECHVTHRTIGRWILDEAVGFPQPVEINKRLYWRRPQLKEWKCSRPAASSRMGAR
jgi:predicted DNA-binding transcriptional regulator AlpA